MFLTLFVALPAQLDQLHSLPVNLLGLVFSPEAAQVKEALQVQLCTRVVHLQVCVPPVPPALWDTTQSCRGFCTQPQGPDTPQGCGAMSPLCLTPQQA